MTKTAGPRRIALVTNSSWYTCQFRLGLMRSLRSYGLEVYVIAPDDDYQASARIVAEGFHFIPLPVEIYSRQLWQELRTIYLLIRLYRRFQFNLLLHYTIKPNIYGAIAAFFCRIPCIAITTGLGFLKKQDNALFSWILRRFYTIASWISREVWFLNEDDRVFFLRHGMVHRRKTFILPSEGVNVMQYRPRELHRHGSQAPFRFLYIGRILWSKGIREFWEAARFFRQQGIPVRFELLGFMVPDHPDGVPSELLQQWQTEGDIHYLGATDDVRHFLAEADCVVLPSYGEGISRVLLESASMGRPIIATDVEGCREVVKHGQNGLLCRPKDSQSLILAMESFLQLPPAERARMGMAGRKLVLEQFDEQLVITAYLRRIRQYLPLKTGAKTKVVRR